MIVDRGHHYWAVCSGLFLAAATAWYVVYEAGEPHGASGGSFEGLVFGIVGTVFILFAALLGIRKRRRHWRIGRAATWLKGHIWIGGLSFFLILFHCGFRFGGPLTQVLMLLFTFVFLTGIYGLILQRFLPKLMTKAVPQEAYGEIFGAFGAFFADVAVKPAAGTLRVIEALAIPGMLVEYEFWAAK